MIRNAIAFGIVLWLAFATNTQAQKTLWQHDRELVDACFAGQASSSIESLKMVKEWFESRKKR
jgi:hypothetical protein